MSGGKRINKDVSSVGIADRVILETLQSRFENFHFKISSHWRLHANSENNDRFPETDEQVGKHPKIISNLSSTNISPHIENGTQLQTAIQTPLISILSRDNVIEMDAIPHDEGNERQRYQQVPNDDPEYARAELGDRDAPGARGELSQQSTGTGSNEIILV